MKNLSILLLALVTWFPLTAAPLPVKLEKPGELSIDVKSHLKLAGEVVVNIPVISTNSKDMEDFYDAFFYRNSQFVLGRRGERIYFNFHDGKSWCASLLSSPTFKLKPNTFHHIAFSMDVHEERSQGELWTQVEIYADGALVAQRRFINRKPAPVDAPLEFGQAKRFGVGWDTHCTLSNALLFDAPITHDYVKSRVMNDSRIKSAIVIYPPITPEQTAKINALKQAVAKLPQPIQDNYGVWWTALDTLARGFTPNDFNECVQQLQISIGKGEDITTAGCVTVFRGNESDLAVAASKNAGRALFVSWYDKKTRRDLLVPLETHLWGAPVKDDTYTSHNKAKNVQLTQNGAHAFTLAWNYDGLDVKLNVTFQNDRLEMFIDVKGTQFNSIDFPVFSLAPLNGSPKLLIPCMGGAVIDNAIYAGRGFEGAYPTGHCSMQLGAWYDDQTGVYFATEDPRAHAKSFSFRPSQKDLKVHCSRPVPIPDPTPNRHLVTNSPAVVQLFRGDWFDAGKIYQDFLKKHAVWYKDAQKKTMPEWFKNNTFWLLSHNPIDKHIKLKEFFGMPYAIHYYGWTGVFDRDYPHHRANPNAYLKWQQYKAAGIRIVPYTNGRIWETKDKRDQDYQYTSHGLPNAVIREDGKPSLETYNKVWFCTMCPVTKEWNERMLKLNDYVLSFGVDGVYMDQVGAARPRMCFNPNHGHIVNDPDFWFMQGYRPMLEAIRKQMAQHFPDTVLTTEDNAEPYIGGFDGVLAWRWIVDGYVPLYPMFYHHLVEAVGRSYGGEPAATIPLLANQFVQGEQMGWCGIGKLIGKNTKHCRLFARRAMYAKRAVQNFFHEGVLQRPIVIVPDTKRILHWGRYESKYVNSPNIERGAWQYKDVELLIFCNTTDKTCSASVKRNGTFVRLSTHGDVPQTGDLTLQPGEIQLWFSQAKNTQECVKRTRQFFKELKKMEELPDPFDATETNKK